MEEYFAPMGDSHKILDGRETRQLPWGLISIGAGALILIVLVLGGWLWQHSRTFSVPTTPFTLHLREAKDLATTPWPSLLGDAWRTPLVQGDIRLAGGTLAEPTWLIAPRWRAPSGWKQDTAHGLYALFLREDLVYEGSRTSQPLNKRPAFARVGEPLLAFGRIDAPSSTAWAISTHGLFTDIPLDLRQTIDLASPYASVYAVQDQPFDSLILQSLAFREQGLAAWRSSLDIVSWSPTPTFEPWSLTLRPQSELSFIDASSTLELTALRDGSYARALRSSPATSSTTITSGEPTELQPRICPLPDVQPFARFQDLALPLTTDSVLRADVALGTQQGQFTICLLTSPSVDN